MLVVVVVVEVEVEGSSSSSSSSSIVIMNMSMLCVCCCQRKHMFVTHMYSMCVVCVVCVVCVGVYIYIYIHIHTYIHTYMHTYIQYCVLLMSLLICCWLSMASVEYHSHNLSGTRNKPRLYNMCCGCCEHMRNRHMENPIALSRKKETPKHYIAPPRSL